MPIQQSKTTFSDSELIYTMSLGLTEGVGPALAKHLIGQCGSAEAVFKANRNTLCNIAGVGLVTAASIQRFRDFNKAEAELQISRDKGVQILHYSDDGYPSRLRECDDGPLVLFCKGGTNLNAGSMISVVGTRKSTAYGKLFTDDFISGLKPTGSTIVSGLASGTDSNAHRASLHNGLPTVAVLGHGLGTMFPKANLKLSEDIIENGALITEFFFNTPVYKENFPKRNRIVAGISDAVVVVESGIKGGSLITADLANGYNRDVYALPGKLSDGWSCGCNKLIHRNQAAIIYNIPELMAQLGFVEKRREARVIHNDLFDNLSAEESLIINLLKDKDLAVDALYDASGLDMNRLSFVLINLEFRNLLRVLPGKVYTLF